MERTNTAGNQRIAELFDAGTFSEIGAYVKRPGDAGCYEGVICGYGAIAGKLAFAFVEDSGRDKGAFDATAAEKINRLYDMAVASGAPVIGVFDSAGARIEDGSAVLSAYAGFLHAVSDASGRVPQIALIGGVCSGLSATAASMFDLRIGVAEKSQFYTVPGRKKSAQALYEGGTFAALCKDDAEAYAFVRRLIDWLPQNSRGEQATDDTANMQAEVAGLSGQSLLDAIADNGASIPLYGGIGKEILTELVRVGGRLVGAIVSDPSVDSGKLTGVTKIGSAWDRRPALLNVNGKVYAVSIYGWPHGFMGIGAKDGLSTQKFPNGKLLYENNNFYGCFCVRFYNSAGHGSANQTVINQHNAAADRAYNYAKQKWPSLCK